MTLCKPRVSGLRCPFWRAPQVELGLVWVWPESGPEALLESTAKQPAFCQRVKDVAPGALKALIHACFPAPR